MNSVRAGADKIEVVLSEENSVLTLRIKDNGCGMTREQVEHLSDPFFTTRKTRKVGLGVPFLRMLAEMTGGSVSIVSKPESEGDGHGTTVTATFHTDHIDFIPLGNLVETMLTLIQGSPDIDFFFSHKTQSGEVRLDTAEMREILGGDVPLNSYEVLSFIKEYLTDQYAQ